LSGEPPGLDALAIEETLDWTESNLAGTPSAEQLRAIRIILDDATFVPVLKEALKRNIGHNSGFSIPNELSTLMNWQRSGEIRKKPIGDGSIDSVLLAAARSCSAVFWRA
jgi:hypothetical protein